MNFQEHTVECKKDVVGVGDILLFKKGEKYEVRVGKSSAVVKDETGCLRDLYTLKNDKFYKEHFKEIEFQTEQV